MSSLIDLQRRFDLRGVRIEAGRGGLTRIAVGTPEGEAHVYLHGAHVTHYQPADGRPILFLSAQSHFESGKAIRGGVPVIFPWFGAKKDDSAAAMHGFARVAEWELTDVRRGTGGSVAVVLELGSSAASRALWPHDFHLRYTVTIGSSLDLSLEVCNTSPDPIDFEEAFHTYLAVGDVRQLHVHGLDGRELLDKTDGMRRKTQGVVPITLVGETDRVYLNTPDPVIVSDPILARRLVVDKDGSASTVLWNPWIAKAKALADFGDNEWPAMLCIETANVSENAITLAAGEVHRMRARISAAPLEMPQPRAVTRQWEMTGQAD